MFERLVRLAARWRNCMNQHRHSMDQDGPGTNGCSMKGLVVVQRSSMRRGHQTELKCGSQFCSFCGPSCVCHILACISLISPQFSMLKDSPYSACPTDALCQVTGPNSLIRIPTFNLCWLRNGQPPSHVPTPLNKNAWFRETQDWHVRIRSCNLAHCMNSPC